MSDSLNEQEKVAAQHVRSYTEGWNAAIARASGIAKVLGRLIVCEEISKCAATPPTTSAMPASQPTKERTGETTVSVGTKENTVMEGEGRGSKVSKQATENHEQVPPQPVSQPAAREWLDEQIRTHMGFGGHFAEDGYKALYVHRQQVEWALEAYAREQTAAKDAEIVWLRKERHRHVEALEAAERERDSLREVILVEAKESNVKLTDDEANPFSIVELVGKLGRSCRQGWEEYRREKVKLAALKAGKDGQE